MTFYTKSLSALLSRLTNLIHVQVTLKSEILVSLLNGVHPLYINTGLASFSHDVKR